MSEDIHKIDRASLEKLKDIYYSELIVFVDFFAMSVSDYATNVLEVGYQSLYDWIAERYRYGNKINLDIIGKLVTNHGLENVLSIYDKDILDFRKKNSEDEAVE